MDTGKNYYIIGMVVLVIILISGCVQQDGQLPDGTGGPGQGTKGNGEAAAPERTFPDPVIEGIGVEIGFYDESTGKAGEFRFGNFTYDWGDIYNEKVFYDYGEEIIRDDGIVLDPQPIFILPLGTKVRAITTGTVISVSKLYSDDYTIQVIRPENSSWVYEHEHVINPLVEAGDNVTAGQVIAEVSDYNEWLREDGYGVLDIGILTTTREGTPLHHCPFMYLHRDIRGDILEKISALYASWEEYAGDSSLYDEDGHAIPGCITTEPIAG